MDLNYDQQLRGSPAPEAPQPPKKRRMLRKILRWSAYFFITIIAIALIFLFVIPWVLSAVTSDIDMVDDKDLQLELVEIPKEQNMYFDLLAFGGPFDSGIEPTVEIYTDNTQKILDHVNGKVWDEKFIGEIVEKNQDAYAVFDRAIIKPYYQYPPLAKKENYTPSLSLPSLNSLRWLARIEALRAFKLFQEDQKAGFDEAVKIIDFGQKLQDSPGTTLIQFLVANAIKNTGLSAFNILIQKTTIEPDTLLPYINTLKKYESDKIGYSNWPKVEYTFIANTIDIIAERGLYFVIPDLYYDEGIESIFNFKYFNPLKRTHNSFYFKPNKTKQILIERTRQPIDNATRFCSQLISNNKEDFTRNLSIFSVFFTENIIGKFYLDLINTNWDNVQIKRCNFELIAEIDKILIALYAYKSDNKKVPQNLDELVPEYLASVPLDPFDGKPLRYSPDKNIIYSVGEKGADLGGSKGEDWRKMENPTFHIKLKR